MCRSRIKLSISDEDVDDMEFTEPRYVPPHLDDLVANTKFSKQEIQVLYQDFKQDSPNGTVDARNFQELYSQFFPVGGTSLFWFTILPGTVSLELLQKSLCDKAKRCLSNI